MTTPDDEPDRHAAPVGGELVAAADTAIGANSAGELVIVVRDATGQHRALGGSRGALRAAVSATFAAGNPQRWTGTEVDDTVERRTRNLPEIMRAAAEAVGVALVHVGVVGADDLDAIAIWFEIDGSVAGPDERRDVLRTLGEAADQQFVRLAAEARRNPVIVADPTPPSIGRSFDPEDPALDALTGLTTLDEYQRALNSYESDEATLVVADLDNFLPIRQQHGDTIADAILVEVADRLIEACRSDDMIARIGPDTFAVLLTEATRAVGLHVAKRLLGTIAKPLTTEGGPASITATIALAHQFGLVDTEELAESADEAIASGKRSGKGRVVVAS